jgi:hypothetical protein
MQNYEESVGRFWVLSSKFLLERSRRLLQGMKKDLGVVAPFAVDQKEVPAVVIQNTQ